jgi:TldD protein
LNYFPVSDSLLQEILSTALSTGGSYSDIYFEHSLVGSLVTQNENVNRAVLNEDYGAGIRVVDGDRTGYAYTEVLSPEHLRQAARTAAAICSGGAAVQPAPVGSAATVPASTIYCARLPWSEVNPSDTLIPWMKTLREKTLEREPRITTLQISISWRTQRIALVNSLGDCMEEERPMAAISVNAVIREDSRTETATASHSLRQGIEILSASLQDDLADRLIAKLRFALTAVQPRGGVMPVVMAAGASGILLHEAIGHAFEADFNRRGESIFSDRMGQLICDPDISVVDDGTVPSARGSIHWDDEGVPSQNTFIVRDGRLESYLHDRISAAHYGVAPTGNGRRESFRTLPLPRMRNTYMLGSSATEADLIASVPKGIYVRDFSNGQVQIGAGDFTFFVKSGYLIENGRLTQPVKDINIIGNGPQALADIHGVADNLVIDNGTWICGKAGQSVAVTCGMPSVLVSSLNVGGI